VARDRVDETKYQMPRFWHSKKTLHEGSLKRSSATKNILH